MLLNRSLWPKLQVFLFVDRKLSDKPSAFMAEKSRFNKLLDYFSTRDFTRDNFNIFIAEMRNKGYAISYINNFIKTVKLLGKYFKIHDFDDYTYFREKRLSEVDNLTPEDIKKLAEVIIQYKKFQCYINQRQKAMILLLGTTGARIGEVLNLTWKDLHSGPERVIFRDTKNGEDRTVCIGPDIFNLLFQLPHKGEYIFSSARNGTLNSQQILLDLKRRAKAIGLNKKIWNHLFRYSYIDIMGQNGVDLMYVAKIVGHRDPRTTMRYLNSSLKFYSQIVLAHPLLKHNISWEMLCQKIKTNINQNVDTQHFNLTVEENSNSLLIKVTK
ncbi:site-specific integrase [Patescibacteria group bacterium]|nr:site-specific integrase [Patescibacteria group bacterium]